MTGSFCGGTASFTPYTRQRSVKTSENFVRHPTTRTVYNAEIFHHHSHLRNQPTRVPSILDMLEAQDRSIFPASVFSHIIPGRKYAATHPRTNLLSTRPEKRRARRITMSMDTRRVREVECTER